MENRFANVGNVMVGEAYIQRKELEKRLLNRTVPDDDDNNYGSVNLVGLQRMGKSSLVYNILEAKADEYYKKNIIVVTISANKFDSADLFFKSIVRNVYNVIRKHGDIDDDIKDYYDDFKNENIEQDGPDTLHFFFESIKDSGKRVVCIVDEFDHCANIFGNFPSGFAILRQLAYEPETHVAFVFVSRRQAVELERKCSKRSEKEISPFYNILGDPIFVKGFSDEEMEEYCKCNEKSGVVLSEKEKETLKSITGGQPFWSDILLKEYKRAKDNGENSDLETIFNEKIDIIYTEYEHTLDLLEEQGLINKLYQLVLGPMDDCTRADIQTLYNYGIITDKEKCTLISEKLYEYMEMKEREVKFYPLWNKTENGLRDILRLKLAAEYKKPKCWEEEVRNNYLLTNPEGIMGILENHFFHENNPADPYYYGERKYTKKEYFLSDNLSHAIGTKEKMERSKKSGVIKNNSEISLLEAMFTRGLFLLCDLEYDRLGLKKIFGEKEDFIKKALHLSDARNTYQHNNDILLTDEYKKKTKEYCEALWESIDKFFKKNSPTV